MLELLQIERSTFYDRKREAILVFGLAMWGGAIPQLKTFLNDTQEEFQNQPWEVISDEDKQENAAAELY